MLTSWKSSKCKLNATLPFILRKWTSQGDLGKFQSSLGHICSKAWMGYKKTQKIMQLDRGMRPCGPGLQLHLSVPIPCPGLGGSSADLSEWAPGPQP